MSRLFGQAKNLSEKMFPRLLIKSLNRISPFPAESQQRAPERLAQA
jgi:hypothetical protein